MAMRKCRECGRQVSTSANACPSCGAKQARPFGLAHIFIILIGVGFIYSIASNDPSSSRQPFSPTGGSSSPTADRTGETLYAHQIINVREGPGTDYSVIGQLSRGSGIRVGLSGEDWREITAGDHQGAWIYTPLLETRPLPNVEIESFSWYPDADFGTSGAVRFTVELRNNTSSNLRNVRVRFSTYDADGQILDSTTTFVRGLSAGGTASGNGFATYFGSEDSARIQIVDR